MLSDADQIRNLLYRYAELVDAGDFEGVGELLGAAEVDWGGEVTVGPAAVTARFEATTRRYDDGTPRTVHVVANPIVDLDGDRAEARSRYVVIQPVGDAALAPIVTGRYHDELRRVDGEWQFARRHYLVDHLGDLSHHLPDALVQLLRDR